MPNSQDGQSQVSDIHTCGWLKDDLSDYEKKLLETMIQNCTDSTREVKIADPSVKEAARAWAAAACKTRRLYVRFLDDDFGRSCKGCHPDQVRLVIDRAELEDYCSSQGLSEGRKGQQCQLRRSLGTSR